MLRTENPSAEWLSRDPVGERGGINLYAYVRNEPILRIDPYGLCDDDDFNNFLINNFSLLNLGFYKTAAESAAVKAPGASLLKYALPATAPYIDALSGVLGIASIPVIEAATAADGMNQFFQQASANAPINPPADAATNAATQANGGIAEENWGTN